MESHSSRTGQSWQPGQFFLAAFHWRTGGRGVASPQRPPRKLFHAAFGSRILAGMPDTSAAPAAAARPRGPLAHAPHERRSGRPGHCCPFKNVRPAGWLGTLPVAGVVGGCPPHRPATTSPPAHPDVRLSARLRSRGILRPTNRGCHRYSACLPACRCDPRPASAGTARYASG